MADYEFSMPYPPSINGYWRTFRGRQIISKRGREYRKHAIEVMNDLGLSGELISERMRLSVIIHPPTLRKYDIDNWCKAPFDALTHAEFWIDDEQIDSLLIKKGEKVKGGLLKIKVSLCE